MFYDYGEYDEAIKRFGVIVTKYPKDPNAGPAGDRILSRAQQGAGLREHRELGAQAQDRAVRSRARTSRSASSRLIVESIQKSGDKYSDAGKFEQAATFYLRVPKETTDAQGRRAGDDERRRHVREGASCPRRPPTSTSSSREVRRQGARHRREGRVRRRRGLREGHLLRPRGEGVRARRRQVRQGRARPPTRCSTPACCARRSARTTRRSRTTRSTRRSSATRKDAPDVAFNIGVVYEDAGQEGPAYQAFADYARVYRSTGKRMIEAHTRAGLHVASSSASSSAPRKTSRPRRRCASTRPAPTRPPASRGRPRRATTRAS